MAEIDQRFGGNIEMANVGKQYSRAFPGGPPGVDRRYENYQRPQQVDYTRNIPRQTGTPNFGGPMRGGSQSPHESRHQGIDYSLYSGASLRDSRRGYESLESTPRGSYLPDRFGRMRPLEGGLGSLEGQQSKVNLMDLYDRLGPNVNWNRLLRQMDERGIEYAKMGGYNPDPYDDEYGPFVPPSVLEMDIFGTDYGPGDEYDFDRKKGYKNRIWGSEPNYVARGGLMSLRR